MNDFQFAAGRRSCTALRLGPAWCFAGGASRREQDCALPVGTAVSHAGGVTLALFFMQSCEQIRTNAACDVRVAKCDTDVLATVDIPYDRFFSNQ